MSFTTNPCPDFAAHENSNGEHVFEVGVLSKAGSPRNENVHNVFPLAFAVKKNVVDDTIMWGKTHCLSNFILIVDIGNQKKQTFRRNSALKTTISK